MQSRAATGLGAANGAFTEAGLQVEGEQERALDPRALGRFQKGENAGAGVLRVDSFPGRGSWPDRGLCTSRAHRRN